MIPCGIAIPQTFERSPIDVQLIREFVPKAETLGYESLWVQEQIISDTLILEPVTLLTYAAALWSRARLGTSVLLPVIRNPVQLAKSLASLDQLSKGRLTVGVGIGGPHVPERVFAVPSERRARRFVETIQVMKALWTQPRATFSGDFWSSKMSRWSRGRYKSRIRRSGSARATKLGSSARCAMATAGW